jgi:cytoskeletal protein CcmA (bactofilin family)
MDQRSDLPAPAARTKHGYRLIAVWAAILVLSGCDGSFDGNDSNKINGTIHVLAGKAPSDVSTVNGAIRVDDNATINSASTVNGSIRLGAHATATSAKTVNGSITLGAGAHLSGSASSVNGDLSLADGAEVSGSLANVNGKIDLTAAHVTGGIKTVDGSISIMGASHVDGGILVQKQSGIVFNSEDPTIIIGPGATVQGELRFERKVRLFVSDRATIGTVIGATAVAFTGDSPPP